MNTSIDIPVLVLLVLLAGSLAAFLLGIFPYPFGILIVLALLVARLLLQQHPGSH
jgi:hypothetical protein